MPRERRECQRHDQQGRDPDEGVMVGGQPIRGQKRRDDDDDEDVVDVDAVADPAHVNDRRPAEQPAVNALDPADGNGKQPGQENRVDRFVECEEKIVLRQCHKRAAEERSRRTPPAASQKAPSATDESHLDPANATGADRRPEHPTAKESKHPKSVTQRTKHRRVGRDAVKMRKHQSEHDETRPSSGTKPAFRGSVSTTIGQTT